jgi:prepilin-type processing-associated H-X9-DG protein
METFVILALIIFACAILFWLGVIIYNTIRLILLLNKRNVNIEFRDRIKTILANVVLLLFFLAVEIMLIMGLDGRGRPAQKAQCQNKMHEIAIALLAYKSEHGAFPPAYVADKDGKPLYSWRVLILPYMGYKELYDMFHLDEPWDSPYNRRLIDSSRAPKAYTCRLDEQKSHSRLEDETNYVMIVGPGTISDGPHSTRPEDITKDPSKCFLVVEVYDSGIHWAEPRDLKAEGMSYRINDPDYISISSRHGGGANAAFCDGYVECLDESTEPDTIRKMTMVPVNAESGSQ